MTKHIRELAIEALDAYEHEIWATKEGYETKLEAIKIDLRNILYDDILCREKIEVLLSAL